MVTEVESYLDWIQRATGEAEQKLKDLNIEDWPSKQRRMKWRWAGQLANMDPSRWARNAAEWDPRWTTQAARCRGHPKTRWTNDIQSFLATSSLEGPWLVLALDCNLWSGLEDAYAATSLLKP